MNSYSFVTTPRRIVLAIVVAASATVVMATAIGSAAEAEEIDRGAAAAELDELRAQLAVQEDQIRVLEEQLAVTRQAALLGEARIGRQRDTITRMQEAESRFSSPLSAEYQSRATEEWRIGYHIGGGRHLRAFEEVILPCESGGELDPFAAIGRTDDWGRAQINRPTWGARFSELTGKSFEEWILDPMLNGYMAAVVEEEQGLRAWTCWRRRR